MDAKGIVGPVMWLGQATLVDINEISVITNKYYRHDAPGELDKADFDQIANKKKKQRNRGDKM